VALGLAYLHSRKVIHGDLRGRNVLIDGQGRPRLADFGLCHMFNEAATITNTSQKHFARWDAPELLDPGEFGEDESNLGSKPTFKGDVYAFACVCYEIYTTKPPFHEIRREATVIVRVLNGQRPRRPVKCDGYAIVPSDKIWSLIEECWDQQSHNRPTMSAVLQRLDGISANSTIR
ncbi:kinase-like protein, partial [Punctularia strigosozonata HHB-11173 SS5]